MATPKNAIIVPALAGVVAGIASSIIFSATAGKPPAVVAPAHAGSAAQSPTVYAPVFVSPPASAEHVEELRTRVRELEAHARATGNGPAPPQDPVAFEEQKLATIQRHEALVKAHREQPVDPAWGPATSTLVRQDLETLAGSSSFKVVEAECKTTSCAGTLEWPNFGAAASEWRKVLHAGFQANCSREVTLPDPADETAPYRATIVLDCESWRAEGH